MLNDLRPWHLLLVSLAGWVNQHQQRAIEYLLEEATLDLITPEELAEVPRFVEVWQRAGHMNPKEGSAWRERIASWRRFRAGSNSTRVSCAG